MNTIYKPKGAAAEYGDYAVNIYTGCPHRYYYCFAPNVLHRDREAFHSCVEPRKGMWQSCGGNHRESGPPVLCL